MLVLVQGFVAQRLPDGITAYFGFPKFLAGAEECACAEALGICAARAELSAELLRRGLVTTPDAVQAVRVGLHSGLAVVGAVRPFVRLVNPPYR